MKFLTILFLLSFVTVKSYPDVAKKQPQTRIKTFHYLPTAKCLGEGQKLFSILSQTAERTKDVLISFTNLDKRIIYAELPSPKPPLQPP